MGRALNSKALRNIRRKACDSRAGSKPLMGSHAERDDHALGHVSLLQNSDPFSDLSVYLLYHV